MLKISILFSALCLFVIGGYVMFKPDLCDLGFIPVAATNPATASEFRSLFAGSFIAYAYLLVRFLSFYFHGQGGHIQSLIISAIGFSLAGILFSLGVIAKLVSYNRNFVEELLFQEKKRRWEAARSDRG